jgi:hypothetical protein
MRRCPTCGLQTPDGHFCVRCGAPLDGTLGHSRARTQFAGAPRQSRRSPRLVSTLFPQLPRHSERHFRFGVALGAVVVLGLGAARLFGVALAVAACLLWVLTMLYLYDVDVYGERPLYAIAWTIGWGLGAGAAVGLIAQALAPTGAALIDRSSGDQVLVAGLLVPAISTALMLAGPLVLLPYRRYNDVLDGTSFGCISAVTVAATQVLVIGSGVLAGGLRQSGAVLPWIERLAVLALATPVLAMGAVGFAAGALWLRFRAPVADRLALGRLGSPVVAIALALALVLAGDVAETVLPVGLWLAWVVLLDLVAIVLLRSALHVGLLEQAAEQPIGPETRCANCGASTAVHTFCGNCGIARAALPRARDDASGAFDGRLTRGRHGRARAAAVTLAIVVGGGIAAGAVALAAPGARRPPCRPGALCGTPPPPRHPTVTDQGRPEAYAYWRRAATGLSLRYVTGEWSAGAQSADEVTLQSSDGISEVTVDAAPASATPAGLIAARVSSLQGKLLGLERDTDPVDQVLGANVGLVPGTAAVYRGTTSLPQAPDTPVSLVLLAGRVGGRTLVATIVTPANDPGEQSAVFEQADDILNSIEVAGS